MTALTHGGDSDGGRAASPPRARRLSARRFAAGRRRRAPTFILSQHLRALHHHHPALSLSLTLSLSLSLSLPLSILYQRGVYPPEAFEQRRQYGLAVMVTSDARLASYLATVLEALEGWLETGTLQKLVLVIAGTPEGDVLERWTFDVQADKKVVAGEAPLPQKDEGEVMAEIAAVIRQITASVTFLPMLNRPCE